MAKRITSLAALIAKALARVEARRQAEEAAGVAHAAILPRQPRAVSRNRSTRNRRAK
jgi:hypothetical protein